MTESFESPKNQVTVIFFFIDFLSEPAVLVCF